MNKQFICSVLKCYAIIKVIMPRMRRMILLAAPPLPKPNTVINSQVPKILIIT